MKLKPVLIASAAVLALSMPPAIAAQAPQVAPPAAETPHDRLFRLFKESDEAQLKRNPLFGIFRGDLRYADQFGDYVTEEYLAAEKVAAEADLAALRAIDYVLAVALIAIVGLSIASMVGVPLGALDPAAAVARALDALAPE